VAISGEVTVATRVQYSNELPRDGSKSDRSPVQRSSDAATLSRLLLCSRQNLDAFCHYCTSIQDTPTTAAIQMAYAPTCIGIQ